MAVVWATAAVAIDANDWRHWVRCRDKASARPTTAIMAEPSLTVTHPVGAKITDCQNRAEQMREARTTAAATISGPRLQARRAGVTRNASARSTKAQNDAPRVSRSQSAEAIQPSCVGGS